MNATLTLIGKEVRDGLRNRWVLAVALLLAALALALGLLGSAPTGSVKVDPLVVTVVSLSSLSIFLVPLIALLLSYDAIVGEIDRGTMALLLSYPVSRAQVLTGKFCGHLVVLSLAIVGGYGAAGILLQLWHGGLDVSGWTPFLLLIGASILLGAGFLALGYLISALVSDRVTAAGIAVGVWLFLVVIFDMGLIGLLVVDQGRVVTAQMLNVILLFNPTDVYRLLNLTGHENIAMFSGMAGLTDKATLPTAALLLAQALWVVVPLTLAAMRFKRRAL
ncbi:ABC transporter permease [Comamonas faecalis]|uniref:ABC transporter permease n=1 Tax=Comamonas faecalis TaxID=1387849 RepID=A0ABP7QE56_9BURK